MIVNSDSFSPSDSPKLNVSFTHKTLFSSNAISRKTNVLISFMEETNLVIDENALIMNSDQTEVYDFWGYNFEGLTIPATVTKIRQKSFENSTFIRLYFKTGSQLSVIENYSFVNCSKLTTIYFLPTNVLSNIGFHAFFECFSLEKMQSFETANYKCVDNTLYYIDETGKHLFLHACKSPEKSLNISCKSIRSYAFNQCDNIENITIAPDSVTLIEEYSFNKCSSLKQINFPLSVETVQPNSFVECDSLVCPLVIENKSPSFLKMIIDSGIPRRLLISCKVLQATQNLQVFEKMGNTSPNLFSKRLSK